MKKIILYTSIVLLLVSCGRSNEEIYARDAAMLQSVNDATSSRKSFATSKMKNEAAENSKQTTVTRKLIKTGDVTFETSDLSATRKVILDLVNSYKGYVSRDNQYKSDDRTSTTIAVRIPAESFDLILEGIAKGVDKFDNKNVRISDVTEQFLDVSARLNTKKALEKKYLEILKKAKTVREILDVERELAKVRGDIESSEGRLKYLQNQVSFSTLNITFYKKTTANELGFGSKIGEAFKQGFENIKAFLVSMIHIWPFIIILFLLIFFVKKRLKRTKS
jgi:hypothetical protein